MIGSLRTEVNPSSRVHFFTSVFFSTFVRNIFIFFSLYFYNIPSLNLVLMRIFIHYYSSKQKRLSGGKRRESDVVISYWDNTHLLRFFRRLIKSDLPIEKDEQLFHTVSYIFKDMRGVHTFGNKKVKYSLRCLNLE